MLGTLISFQVVIGDLSPALINSVLGVEVSISVFFCYLKSMGVSFCDNILVVESCSYSSGLVSVMNAYCAIFAAHPLCHLYDVLLHMYE